MGLLNLTSAASAWRGYEYYNSGKVKSCQKVDDNQYEGEVAGSNERCYQVNINLEHPRSSRCSCPHAEGKRIVCKHMVALFFSAFPEEAEDYYREVILAEEEAEQQQERLEEAVIGFVMKMNKEDLQQELLQMLFDGPEWQLERFARDNLGEWDE